MSEELQQVFQFVSEHPELFDSFERMYIKQYLQSVQVGRHDIFLPDVIRELFDYFQMQTLQHNLDQIYFLPSNILQLHFCIHK